MKLLPPIVLLTSASRKVPLVKAVQDAAQRLHADGRVIAGDSDPRSVAAYLADDFWAMPRTDEASVHDILNGCKERGVTCILPTRNGELLFWARNARQFHDVDIQVIVSPIPSLEVCLDKQAFFEFGRARSLPFIPTDSTPDPLPAGSLVVKERYGAGSLAIGLNLDRNAAVAHARQLSTPVYQPYVVGTEISIDAWLDGHHRVKGIVLRTRDYVIDGESVVPTTFRDPAIEAKTAEILETLQLCGPVVMQALIDGDNVMNVIECNPRFGGASTTAIAAGLDSLYWSLLEAQNVDVARYPFSRVPGEVRQVRVPSDLHYHGSSFRSG
jgi:carbamoyl-phosphate synthase large subunit